MMIPKRRLLTLIFACLCFKKSLLIIIIIIITIIIIKTTIRSVIQGKKLEGILIFNLISRTVASMRQTEALASVIFFFSGKVRFFF